MLINQLTSQMIVCAPDNINRIWNREFIEYELDCMLDMLDEEKNNDKCRFLFLKELFIERGYSDSLFSECTSIYREESWFREKYNLIKDILHIRLLKLGLADPKRASMVIWLDKTNYGSREPETAKGGDIVIVTKEVEL